MSGALETGTEQEYVLAEVTGKEVQPSPGAAPDPGQGLPDPPLPADPFSLGPHPTALHGPPQQHQATFQQPPVGGHAAGPSRKRPKSISPAPAAAQVAPLKFPKSLKWFAAIL